MMNNLKWGDDGGECDHWHNNNRVKKGLFMQVFGPGLVVAVFEYVDSFITRQTIIGGRGDGKAHSSILNGNAVANYKLDALMDFNQMQCTDPRSAIGFHLGASQLMGIWLEGCVIQPGCTRHESLLHAVNEAMDLITPRRCGFGCWIVS
jgi:hypothetical protein